MNPIQFPEANVVFGRDQSEYTAMPAHKVMDGGVGVVTACWRLSLRERLRVLAKGRVWSQTMTFHVPRQPQRLSAEKPRLGQERHDAEPFGVRLLIFAAVATALVWAYSVLLK